MNYPELNKPVFEIEGLSLHYVDDVAVIEMNRGENRLNINFLDAFKSLLDDVERNESCTGLITIGVGKVYSNGVDLESFQNYSAEESYTFHKKIWEIQKRLTCFPVPTVAAINGHCFAGGAVIAFAHDLRIMKGDGRGWICLNEVIINFQFLRATIDLLRAKLGDGKNLHKALVLGHRYTAQEALQAGFLHSVTPDTSLLIKESVRAIKDVHGKQGLPRDSLANMKRDVFGKFLNVSDTELKEYAAGFKSRF